MAWTYEQKFNSLTTGDLNGQDSWSGDTEFDVQESVTYEGAKAIQVTDPGGQANGNIVRTISGVSSGVVYFAMRVSGQPGTYSGWSVYFQDVTNSKSVGIEWLRSAIGIAFNVTGTGRTYIIPSAPTGTWIVFAIEFDASENQARVKWKNGDDDWTDWSSWKAVSTPFSQIDKISLVYDFYSGGGPYQFDTITPTDPTVVPVSRRGGFMAFF